jgi:FAD/FMN-containing dehydrogenase
MAVPERTATLRASGGDINTALRTAAALRTTGLPLDALAIVTGAAAERCGDARTSVFVRVSGPHEAVERVTRAVRERTGATDVDTAVWETIASLPAVMDHVARAGWPGGHEPPDGLGLTSAVVYPGSGIAFLLDATSPESFTRMRAKVEAADGALVVERGAPEFKRAVGGAWGRARVPAAIARSLKQRFDPHGVLAPGRLPLASST